ncbi:site-specific integrase [uncultured Hyphomicrobium sp.]|uniref:tyrosine-type recombinase/integrase n=1 Tax=uncultured Hyphomicrobium sp. TaxID=194373 RepID=UPI0025FB0B70|nr:site-specific integrase [uncultured Hyphomicrobium sp.]
MATLLLMPSGIYYARHIYRQNGKRREKRETLDTKDLKVALRRLAKWKSVNVDNKWGDGEITFDAVATKFIRHHCTALKPATVERYEVSLRQLRPVFDSKLITDIKPADLLNFEMIRRKHSGRSSTKKKKVPVATASIRKDLLVLSSILSYAVMEGWTEVNPVPLFLRKRKASGLTDSEPRRQYLSEEVEARFLAALKRPRKRGRKSLEFQERRDDVMRYAAAIVDLDAGLREDERMSLKWTDLQFGRTPHFAIRETKSGKPRRVPMLDRVREVLQALPVHPTSPYVFCKANGKRYGSFRNGMLAAAKEAGIEDFTEHDLRRTCGCRLLQKHKRSMIEVSKWLGHSSVRVTERHYAFLEAEMLDDIVTADRTARQEREAAAPSAEVFHLRSKL